ncbi:MAG: hypothetical protein ACE5D4_03850, partial [Thermodesulfobacteriota bacterium]
MKSAPLQAFVSWIAARRVQPKAPAQILSPIFRSTPSAVVLTVMIPPVQVAGTTVTDAVPAVVPSASLTALIVTVAGEGALAGAVYRPVASIVPTVALPPATPLTCQVTVVVAEPVTVSENCFVLPTSTLAVDGETDTATAPLHWAA